MLLPNDALIGWAAIAVPTAIAVWRWPRNRAIWLGLAIATAGFVYAYAVMANRPHNYYAILEVYAGGFAMAVGTAAHSRPSSAASSASNGSRTVGSARSIPALLRRLG